MTLRRLGGLTAIATRSHPLPPRPLARRHCRLVAEARVARFTARFSLREGFVSIALNLVRCNIMHKVHGNKPLRAEEEAGSWDPRRSSLATDAFGARLGALAEILQVELDRLPYPSGRPGFLSQHAPRVLARGR